MYEENYYYKVYYGETLLRDSSDNEEYYETEDEAKEEAEDYIEYKIDQWRCDDAWHEWDSRNNFDVVIVEV